MDYRDAEHQQGLEASHRAQLSKKFELTKEEVKYLVQNIQHEYLSKETYHFAVDLFNRMEEFLKEK